MKFRSLDELDTTLKDLKSRYQNVCLISFIDGEYGMMEIFYETAIKEYLNVCKDKYKIGLCKKGHTTFLRNKVDIILELEELSSILDYSGKDGWKLPFSCNYDKINSVLENLKLKSYIYSTIINGTWIFNKRYAYEHKQKNNNYLKGKSIEIGLLNGNPYTITNKNIDNEYMKLKIDKYFDRSKLNRYAIWIRNSNKWIERNFKKEIYLKIFEHCISNNIYLYVFQDIIKIDLPNNEYIIDCAIRYDNCINVDKFVDICNNCSIFFGCVSGTTHIAHRYTSCVLYTQAWHSKSLCDSCYDRSFENFDDIRDFLTQMI